MSKEELFAACDFKCPDNEKEVWAVRFTLINAMVAAYNKAIEDALEEIAYADVAWVRIEQLKIRE
jgi:hypothetical protein